MNFWQGFSQIIAGIGRSFRLNWGRGQPSIDSAESDSGISVTQDNALTLSAVWACVGLISQTISTLPISMYRREGGKTIWTPEHPLHELLHYEPNANMTAVEFWEMLLVSVLLWGNGYAAKRVAVTGQVIALDPWLPQHVTPYLSDRGLLRYTYDDGTRKEDLPGDMVLHIKGFSADGLSGLSPIAYARQSLGRALATEDAAGQLFASGMRGRMIFTYDKVLQKDQRDAFRTNLVSFQNAANRGAPFLLEGGMAYKGITMNPEDAELLESRGFSVEDICRFFYRTPPQLIGHTNKASSWASSLENTNLGFLTYGLRSLITRIEQAVRKSLLTPVERRTYFAKFKVEGLLRADSAGRAALYASALLNGWMDRDEVRELEDLEPRTGGDVLTVQSNLISLVQVGKAVQTPAQVKSIEDQLALSAMDSALQALHG